MQNLRERKRFKDQLAQRLRPGEIKSVKLLIENLNFDDVNEDDYEKAYKQYKTSRDNFSRKSEDQRVMFEELKKLANMRLHILNMTFNRPAETEAGKDFVKRTDQTLAGKWYRFKQWLKRNGPGAGIGATLMGIFYFTYDIIKSIASNTRAAIVGGYRASAYVMKKAYSYVPSATTTSNLLNTATSIFTTGARVTADAIKLTADTAKFVADNTISVFVAIIALIGIIYSMIVSRKK